MHRVVPSLFMVLYFLCRLALPAFAEGERNEDVVYSLLFSSKIAGSHDILAKTATAAAALSGERGCVLSLGSVVGKARIVEYDWGEQFMAAAREAGIDYIVPGAGEFMYGMDAFRKLAADMANPVFVSANVLDEKTRQPLVRPYALLNVSGMRICIVPMSDMDIIKSSDDKNVPGIDVISAVDAFQAVAVDIRRQYPNLVIVVGRIDRESIMKLSRNYPVIDMFVTTGSTAGFSAKDMAARMLTIAGKPVYFAPEETGHLGYLAVRSAEGVETREFTDISLGEAFPPDKLVLDGLTATLDSLARQDKEEQYISGTGLVVANLLKGVYNVDVVAFERESLYYYPLKDSLTLPDVGKIVKPDKGLATLTMSGVALDAVWKKSLSQTDPSLKLHIAGITPEGKIDDIPIQPDREYSVLTTPFLLSGGDGYTEFINTVTGRVLETDMIDAVQDTLVAKDVAIRKAEKKKIWSLAFNLALGSNVNKTDVDRDKAAYGSAPPKEYRDLNDLFTGYFEVSSWDDVFKINYKRNQFESRLRARYVRSGLKTEEKKITYREGRDELQLINKYIYDLASFKSKPFAAIDIYSELYYPVGKHPISASARTGLSREITSLWNTVVEVGIDGTRNYVTNDNTFGTTSKAILNKSFPAKGLFTTPTKLSVDGQVTWNPMAKYHMAFFMRNNNRIDFQLLKKFNLTFNVRSYSYRDTRQRKMTVGFIYDLTLNYRLDWNI